VKSVTTGTICAKTSLGKNTMDIEMKKVLPRSFLGKTVYILIDRPLGSKHPKFSNLVYPIHYGYIPGVLGGDGEELDVYLLGVDTPVTESSQ
jgi:inorganic pyrophosphatase